MMSRIDRLRLADLRYHWGDAFTFTLDPNGIWIALSLTDGTVSLHAATADELRQKIRAAYRGRRR